MGTGAGLLNKPAQFFRRQLSLQTGSGPYVPFAGPQWSGYRPKGARDVRVGGLELQLATGVVTVRDSATMRSVTTRDQVDLQGARFEIYNIVTPEKTDGMIRFEVQTGLNRAVYLREMEAAGDVVEVTRPGTPAVTKPARAIVIGYRPEELVGGVLAAHRRVILYIEDLETGGFPLPLRVNDTITWQGRAMRALAVDASTHRFGGVINALEIQAGS